MKRRPNYWLCYRRKVCGIRVDGMVGIGSDRIGSRNRLGGVTAAEAARFDAILREPRGWATRYFSSILQLGVREPRRLPRRGAEEQRKRRWVRCGTIKGHPDANERAATSRGRGRRRAETRIDANGNRKLNTDESDTGLSSILVTFETRSDISDECAQLHRLQHRNVRMRAVLQPVEEQFAVLESLLYRGDRRLGVPVDAAVAAVVVGGAIGVAVAVVVVVVVVAPMLVIRRVLIRHVVVVVNVVFILSHVVQFVEILERRLYIGDTPFARHDQRQRFAFERIQLIRRFGRNR